MSHFTLTTPFPGALRATFDRPPANLLTDQTVVELEGIADALEHQDLRVAIFDSGNPDYFMARYDVSTRTAGSDPGAALRRFADVAERISAAPVVTVASIRGRARGGGNEIALACDVRFASWERAFLCQPEVPFGILPGGGGIERLAGLIGYSRAVEVVISGEDYDAATAELYGWVNRAIPDDELDAFVDGFARRISGFDRAAVATAKQLLKRSDTYRRAHLDETITAVGSVAASASAERRRIIAQRAATLGPDFERDLPRHLDV